mmetsp:Transcript_54988/g.129677  ORF Transcript_54988/g.129677 Transcript_54988/m.129677 type:complete len:403 (+) Transcript_54988:83-1291(+)
MAMNRSEIAEEGVAGVGIYFEQFEDGKFVVQRIAEDGPAARHGRVQEGDVLLSVDGIEVWGLNLDQIKILILGQPGSPVEIRLARSHVSFNGSAGIAYSTILVRQSTPSSDLQSSVRKDEHEVAPGHQPQQEPAARQPELNTSQSVQATPTTSKHKTSGKSADRKNSIEPRAHVSPTRSPGEGSVVSLKSRPGGEVSVEETKRKLDLAILEVEKAREVFQRKVEEANECLRLHRMATEKQLERDLHKLEKARDQVEEQNQALLQTVGASQAALEISSEAVDEYDVTLTQDHEQASHLVNSPILLNVGGKEFVTTQATLSRYPDSHLAKLFLGDAQVELPRDSRGRHFVDCNPKCFAHVIEFLETDAITSKLSVRELAVLEADARRFGLSAFLQYLRTLSPEV